MMSLEATIARAISLNSNVTISNNTINSSKSSNSTRSNSNSNVSSSVCNLEKGTEAEYNLRLKQQDRPQIQEKQQQNKSKHSSIQRAHKKVSSSGQEGNHWSEQQQHKIKRQAPKPPHSNKKEPEALSTRTTTAAKSPSSCHLLVEQILYTVGELEHTLVEDHQTDFELRMALERQIEQVHDLRSSLELEKKRNQRLVQLIRGVDSSSSTEDEELDYMRQHCGVGMGSAVRRSRNGTEAGARYLNSSRWQSRSSMDAFESISPLLMQQRYDELSMSHKQCRRQLAKKEKLLTRIKCEKEDLQGQYDNLLDEYRNVQKRFEELCYKYLRLQAKKNQEIQKLREALSYASDCVLSAQQVMEYHKSDANCCIEFTQNLQYFIKALRLCEWVQHLETQRDKR